MRYSRTTGLLVLVVLGATSFHITTSVLKQRRAMAAQRRTVTGETRVTTTEAVAAGAGSGLHATSLRLNSVSAVGVSHMEALAIGGQLVVTATAHIEEVNPKFKYVWSLIIRDHASGDLVWRRDYLDNVFWLTEPGKATPVFREAILIEHGHYQVTVAVFRTSERFPTQKIATAKLGDPDVPAFGLSRDVLVP